MSPKLLESIVVQEAGWLRFLFNTSALFVHVARASTCFSFHKKNTMKLTLAALLLCTMSSLSSSATATPDTFVGSIAQNAYYGLGCNESNFYAVDVTKGLVVLEENKFCESDVFPGQNATYHGAYTTTCDDDEKTVLFTWYACNTTDCSDCVDPSVASVRWKVPMSDLDEPTEETCFEMDMLPPYDPIMNFTSLSYRFTDDPSTYVSIIVENSCISKSLARGSTSGSTPSSKPSSSGEWAGLNVCWYYLVASVGFALLLG